MTVLFDRFLTAFKEVNPQSTEMETFVVHSESNADDKLKKIMTLARPLLAKVDPSKTYEPLAADHLPDRRLRSELLHGIGTYYTQKTSQDPYLDKKHFMQGLSDGYLRKAEDVVYRSAFSHFPTSRERLKPLADKYIIEWRQLLGILSRGFIFPGRETHLEEQIQSFVLAHRAFGKRFFKEYELCGIDSFYKIKRQFPSTVKLFYGLISQWVANSSSRGVELKKMIQTDDKRLEQIVPYLLILQIIKSSFGERPELLQPYQEKIDALRLRYQQLDAAARSSLEISILDQDKNLNPAAHAIHCEIQQLLCNLSSSQEGRSLSNCFKLLIQDFKEDFLSAEKMGSHLKSAMSSSDISLNAGGALYTLLHLSTESIAELSSFLPTLIQLAPFHDAFERASPAFRDAVKKHLCQGEKLDSTPDFMRIDNVRRDLEGSLYLYRLLGIIQAIFPDIKTP